VEGTVGFDGDRETVSKDRRDYPKRGGESLPQTTFGSFSEIVYRWRTLMGIPLIKWTNHWRDYAH